MYSVILHYSKCYCVLLLTDVFLFFFFSSLSQHDSVCNYYVVQLQTSVVFVFSESTVYSVILHYSKCYCVLLLMFVVFFFFFSSLSQHDSVCNYYVVQLQTIVVFVFSLSLQCTV